MLPSQGGSIHFQGSNYNGYLGAGDLDGAFGVGAYVNTTFHSHVIGVGDQPILFDLPTDIFVSNHFYPTRGVGITAHEGNVGIFGFVGGTALVRGTSFFESARADLPIAMVFIDRPISGTLHFFSKSVVSHQRTSIQALDWHPRKWLRGGIAGGIGSNQPYLATSVDVETDWLSLKAAYTTASGRFRRITQPSVIASEVTRENVSAVIKPSSNFLFTVGHQNLLQPSSPDFSAPFLDATVNQAQSTFDLHEFRFGAGIFQASFQGRKSTAEDFSISRRVMNNLEFSANHFYAASGTGPHASNFSTSIRETISPRLSVLQVVNYSAGRTTVLYGGSYLSNSFTLGVDYQTLYLPFRPNPFSQGINISLRIRLFGSFEANAQTFRSSAGRLRYTVGGNTVLTRNFRPAVSETQKSFKHFRYIVQGRVQDEKGDPIEGAALLVGGELVLTNAAGEFFVRQKTATALSLRVRLEEFLNPASFRVITCPKMVNPAPDRTAAQAIVVLGRN